MRDRCGQGKAAAVFVSHKEYICKKENEMKDRRLKMDHITLGVCYYPDQTNGMKDRNSSQMLARTRSISPVFGIMEQQSGAGGWNCRMMMPMPKPGQMRLWSLQAIAHGADFVSYFRWRTATVGTEIYWHG